MKKFITIITFLFLQISTIASQTFELISEGYIRLFNKAIQTSSLSLISEAVSYIKKNETVFKEVPNGNFYYNLYLLMANYALREYDMVIELAPKCQPLLDSSENGIINNKNKADILYYIGEANFVKQNLSEAEENYLMALNIIKAFDNEEKENSQTLRRLLVALGRLNMNLQNYKQSLLYLRDAKYLFELNLDFGADYANCIGLFANGYQKDGDYLNAKLYNDVAMNLLLKSDQQAFLGESWVIQLLNSSVIYNSLGYPEESAKMLEKALAKIDEYGLDESVKEAIYDAQAYSFFIQKDFLMAKKMWRKAAKYNDIDYLCGVALCEYLTSDENLIKTSQRVSNNIVKDVLGKFSFLSTEQRTKYWDNYSPTFNMLNYFLIHNVRPNTGTVYNNTLFAKGLLLRESSRISDEINRSNDNNLKLAFERLKRYRDIVSQNILDQDSTRIINDSISVLDKFLTKAVHGYEPSESIMAECDWNNIKNSLNENEVAIEFIQLPDTIAVDSITQDWMYYAVVIKPDFKEPVIVPLCKEQDLKKIFNKDVTTLNSSGRRSQLNKYITNIYTTKNPKYTNGEKLYTLLWQPLEKMLDGLTTVYYSPTGILNSISFAAITHKNIPICDKYELLLLSSTAEIKSLKESQDEKINNAIIYGGIPYSPTTEELETAARGYTHKREAVSLELASRGTDRGGLADLDGTFEEAVFINEYLRKNQVESKIMSGISANEESFKALSENAPNLIHLATHGFFLSDSKVVALHPFMQSTKVQDVTAENALTRSGVCFAGANRAWTGIDVIPNIEDGILTADELSRINLSNTKLVVLSACETGLGETVSSEGVFGLQRSLKLAGVDSIIMSLWKVDDNATAEFMKLFYEKWLSGSSRRQAFSFAQKQIKEKKEFASPYYWAGFVMLD